MSNGRKRRPGKRLNATKKKRKRDSNGEELRVSTGCQRKERMTKLSVCFGNPHPLQASDSAGKRLTNKREGRHRTVPASQKPESSSIKKIQKN